MQKRSVWIAIYCIRTVLRMVVYPVGTIKLTPACKRPSIRDGRIVALHLLTPASIPSYSACDTIYICLAAYT